MSDDEDDLSDIFPNWKPTKKRSHVEEAAQLVEQVQPPKAETISTTAHAEVAREKIARMLHPNPKVFVPPQKGVPWKGSPYQQKMWNVPQSPPPDDGVVAWALANPPDEYGDVVYSSSEDDDDFESHQRKLTRHRDRADMHPGKPSRKH